MHVGKLLKCADNPAGWRIGELIRAIRMELDSRAIDHEGALRASALRISGHLLLAEAEIEQVQADGRTLDGFGPPRLAPSLPRR